MATGRVCLVTGGGAGIGRASVIRFAGEGWRVLALDQDAAAARGVARDLAGVAGAEVLGAACDVSVEDDCRRAAELALSQWGRIDALVANAGVQTSGRLLDATPADWDHLVGVNIRGVINACVSVLPAMVAARQGAIVIVSSINAHRAPPAMALYDMTKTAVIGLMRNIAVDHGKDGIRANAICPGATLTDHHLRAAARRGQSEADLRTQTQGYGLLGRVAEPSEVAAAIHFLASDDASFITGAILNADGGASVRA